MENVSIVVYLEAHSSMVKEGADQFSVVLFTKDNMEADKPVPVVNISAVRFIGDPSKKGRTGNIQGAWVPDWSLAVVAAVGVPVEEKLSDIGMNARRAVIHL